jgi:hypothetical protein
MKPAFSAVRGRGGACRPVGSVYDDTNSWISAKVQCLYLYCNRYRGDIEYIQQTNTGPLCSVYKLLSSVHCTHCIHIL